MPKNTQVKPFLKWVGGKTKLLSEIEKNLPKNLIKKSFNYVEPFLGGGAVFFHLIQKFDIEKAYLNDLNNKLIDVYKDVRDKNTELIQKLKKLESDYYGSSDKKMFFLGQREKFNSSKKSVQKSALFIFLNKTGFNGMYRENSKGEYNIPFGQMKVPVICNKDLLEKTSKLLKDKDITFSSKSFDKLILTNKDTFYYLDPPYRPISKTSSFTDYTKSIFNDKTQRLLKEYCDKIDKKGSLFMQSNSYSEDGFFQKLYQNRKINNLKVMRTISADGNKRSKAKEIIIKNYE
jgi:DNA adenine methylase